LVAGAGEGHTRGGARERRRPKSALEAAYQLAERRRSEMEAGRRAPEVTLGGHRHEGLELANLHATESTPQACHCSARPNDPLSNSVLIGRPPGVTLGLEAPCEGDADSCRVPRREVGRWSQASGESGRLAAAGSCVSYPVRVPLLS